MFTKIIVGLDGLDGGADALALARMLASDESEVTLLHAYPLEHRPSRAAVPDYDAVIRKDAEKLLADAAPSDRPTTALAVGDLSPARALHQTAEERGADLIVIGSCHRSTVGSVLLGDVSRSALHGAPCPVAVAPHGYRTETHSVTSIGVGFNDTDESRAALALGADMAGETGAELRVLCAAATPIAAVPGYAYSYDPPDAHEAYRVAAQQALEAAVAALDVPAQAEMIDDSAGKALAHLSEHVDLVIAGSRGWGAARRVVLGSTTDHLTHHATCPVIVVPGPAAAHAEGDGSAAEPAHA